MRRQAEFGDATIIDNQASLSITLLNSDFFVLHTCGPFSQNSFQTDHKCCSLENRIL